MLIILLALGRRSKFTNEQVDFQIKERCRLESPPGGIHSNLEVGHKAPHLQHSTRQVNYSLHSCSHPGTELRAAPSACPALGTAASHWVRKNSETICAITISAACLELTLQARSDRNLGCASCAGAAQLHFPTHVSSCERMAPLSASWLSASVSLSTPKFLTWIL